MKHKKIILGESRFGGRAFADYCHFGEGSGTETPLVIYAGGAITREEYEAREGTAPEAIIGEFGKAVKEAGAEAADLLVIPSPVRGTKATATLRKAFLQFVVFDLMPETGNPRPQRMGMVGYSFGAFLAGCLALDLPRARAFAAIGGNGMAEAVIDSPDAAFAGKSFIAFANADDPMSMEIYKFLHALVGKGMDMDPVLKPGGHEFADYAGNGSVEEAFKFVLERALADAG
jgi:pimeloyl-ACP methyl ester carboxylesterase